eukprot:TRINITY_DN8078_c0_g1_i3.p1 TRINITY_DN8078_c0_g1~~TRINITY_DN8078_c0_g1_i3.p1  ORF type:complete len:114 (+),score=42.53 TRINITY_DN8078_c0_g1_i3:84-425(+)
MGACCDKPEQLAPGSRPAAGGVPPSDVRREDEAGLPELQWREGTSGYVVSSAPAAAPAAATLPDKVVKLILAFQTAPAAVAAQVCRQWWVCAAAPKRKAEQLEPAPLTSATAT